MSKVKLKTRKQLKQIWPPWKEYPRDVEQTNWLSSKAQSPRCLNKFSQLIKQNISTVIASEAARGYWILF